MRRLLSSLLLLCLFSGTALAGPRIAFRDKDKTYDFGTRVLGQTVRHEYRFTNEGDAPLRIRQVKPSCACTVHAPGKTIYAPGEEGAIEVVFDSSGRLGHQDIQITVISNDPEEKDQNRDYTSVLRLTGEVITLYQVMPPSAYFQSYVVGKRETRTVTILPDEDEPLTVEAIEPPAPYIQVKKRPVKRNKKSGVELEITVTEEAPPGRLDSSIRIETGSKRQPVLHVPVIATILKEIVFYPDRAAFYLVNKGEGAERTVTLERLKGDGGLPIRDVLYDKDLFDVTLETIIPNKRIAIQIAVKKTAPAGFFQEEIRVRLSDSRVPLLRIPAFGEVESLLATLPSAFFFEHRVGDPPAPLGSIDLLHRGGETIPFEEVAIEGDAPLSVRTETLPGGHRIRFHLTQTSPLSGPGEATLLIRTKVPGEESIRVPVFWD